jgi:hypothetical protein
VQAGEAVPFLALDGHTFVQRLSSFDHRSLRRRMWLAPSIAGEEADPKRALK